MLQGYTIWQFQIHGEDIKSALNCFRYFPDTIACDRASKARPVIQIVLPETLNMYILVRDFIHSRNTYVV